MSQENVQVVRRALDAYVRRDVEVLRAVADPNIELDWSASRGCLAGVYRGSDETLRFYEGYFEAFDAIVIEPDRFIGLTADTSPVRGNRSRYARSRSSQRGVTTESGPLDVPIRRKVLAG